MLNPGVYTLLASQIAAPKAFAICTPITGLAGMRAASLSAFFQYGSGGATCPVIVATTLDGGVTWLHIARFDFTTQTSLKEANIQADAAKAVASYADLGSEGVNDGILGDQLAVLLPLGSGNYANTVLSVRAAVR